MGEYPIFEFTSSDFMPFSIHRKEFPNDPLNNQGYWSKFEQPSTLNWCEEDYTITPYIAEFWNTISNLNYMILGMVGLYCCYKVKAEVRDFCAVIGVMMLIGMGSWLFHMTLLYPLQLSDELPMLYGTCCLLYCLFNMFPPSRYAKLIGVGLFLYSIGITIAYEYTKIPIVFHLAYANLANFAIGTPFWNIWKLYKTHPVEAKVCLRAHLIGMTGYVIGFVLWCIDNMHCDDIRTWRENAPFVMGVFAQFHAWWHIFTGIGAFEAVMLSMYMRQVILGRKDLQVSFFGPYPRVIVKSKKE